MEDNKLALERMRAGRFIENNGKVLRTINILRHKFEALKDVAYALPDIKENEFLDCVNFLAEAGYIQLRGITGKAPAELADEDWRALEAKLSANGIRLLGGELDDRMIDA